MHSIFRNIVIKFLAMIIRIFSVPKQEDMFIELNTANNTVQLINTDNIVRIEYVGNNRPIMHFVDGSKVNFGSNKERMKRTLGI